MRCAQCEEVMELLDVCETCQRYNVEPKPLNQRGRNLSSLVKGVCVRGHAMRWAGARWRCKPCEAMYAERKRQKRKAER